MIIPIIILGWLLCSFLAYGIMFAYFQREFPTLAEEGYRHDMGTSLLIARVFGPLALLVYFCLSGFCEHGFKIY